VIQGPFIRARTYLDRLAESFGSAMRRFSSSKAHDQGQSPTVMPLWRPADLHRQMISAARRH